MKKISKPKQFNKKPLELFIKELMETKTPLAVEDVNGWFDCYLDADIFMSFKKQPFNDGKTVIFYINFFDHLNQYYNNYNRNDICRFIIAGFPNTISTIQMIDYNNQNDHASYFYYFD